MDMLSQVPNSQMLLNVHADAATVGGNQHPSTNLAEGQIGLNPLLNVPTSATAPINYQGTVQTVALQNGGDISWQPDPSRFSNTATSSGLLFCGIEGPLQFGKLGTPSVYAPTSGPPQGEAGPLRVYPLRIIGSPAAAVQSGTPISNMAPSLHPEALHPVMLQSPLPNQLPRTENGTLADEENPKMEVEDLITCAGNEEEAPILPESLIKEVEKTADEGELVVLEEDSPTKIKVLRGEGDLGRKCHLPKWTENSFGGPN
ncbi:hypothetical protein R1flu_003238 [Riccia fluitans]|uniref:Uncharacterized protein n=1 Tax=Riccia fluitans TaxID=41844 RepID=A0ABD1Y8E9_9MARC